jgi:hypothetical protein
LRDPGYLFGLNAAVAAAAGTASRPVVLPCGNVLREGAGTHYYQTHQCIPRRVDRFPHLVWRRFRIPLVIGGLVLLIPIPWAGIN